MELASICLALSMSAAAAFGAGSDQPGTGVLDGMRFAGTTGETGATDGREDRIDFDNARMGSLVAREQGFEPGPYYAKQLDGGYHFGATMRRQDGAMLEWKGTIAGNEMEAHYRWKHESWTWMVERSFWFRGIAVGR